MRAVSDDIKDLLMAESDLGLTFAENLFISREPLTPDDVVTLYDTTGGGINSTLAQDSNYRNESIQIRVRNHQATEAWKLINSITMALHGRANFECNGSLYLIIYCMSGPAFLTVDDQNRAIYIVNFDTQRKEVTDGK